MPQLPEAWLEEIAEAYKDALETIPFGPLVGQEIKPEDLFHLGPRICLKFRGLDPRDSKLLKQATDAALASYVGTKGQTPAPLEVPQIAFAFTYLASHFGLDLLDAQQVEEIMGYVEINEGRLVEMTKE
jgi:hypothetical protein